METAPQSGSSNPAGWPDPLLPVFDRAVTVEYTSLTRAGEPIMTPLTPFLGEDMRTLDVSTGLTYPAKAERARRNSKVCLLFSDPVGSELDAPPVVLVQGLATVRDSDIQANTDRYVRLSVQKLPAAYKGMPRFLLRTLNAYFARIWIQVTPTRMWWWPSKSLDDQPGEWIAPDSTTAPPSDPAPPGKQPSAWKEPPTDWRTMIGPTIERLEQRDLAWLGPDGFPLSVPVVEVQQAGASLRLGLGRHLPAPPEGRAAVTFHAHPESFTGQENHTFVGAVRAVGGEYIFDVDRVLGDFSLVGNRLVSTVGFLRNLRRLKPRLESESARRGQPVPKIRLPAPGVARPARQA
jgi:hypothetical protein